MNDSRAEANNSQHLTDLSDQDALYDQFEALLYRMAKLVGQRASDNEDFLPMPHYMLLRTLEQRSPIRVSDIASHLGAKAPAVSMLLHVLDEEGYIDRQPDPADRRATLVSLSETGKERVAVAEEQRREFMTGITSKLTAKQLTDLIAGLNAVADSVAEIRAVQDVQTPEGT